MNTEQWSDLFASLKSPAFSMLRDLNLTRFRFLCYLELETGLSPHSFSSVLETLLSASIHLYFMEIDCFLSPLLLHSE